MKRNLLASMCLCLVLGGLAFAAHAETKAQAGTKAPSKGKAPTWDYATLVRSKFWDRNRFPPAWTAWETMLNDTVVTDPKRTLDDYLKVLGSDGWELVSVAPLSGEDDRVMYYVFKRPKP